MSFLQDFVSIFYPQVCLGCKQPLVKNERLLCLLCHANLPYTDFHKFPDNKIQRVFTGRFGFQKATAFLYFSKGGIVQSILHHLKYRNFPEAAILMGEIMGERLGRDGFFSEIDSLVPVPLHPNKQKKRGYNQSEMLCKGLESTAGIPVSTQNLTRTTFSQTQTRKSSFERWRNVEKIFSINKPKAYIDKHLLLVDDIITTGSTVEACAVELNAIENTKVSLLTLAHT